VYVFRSAGLEVLKAARARGSKTILEQPIAARQVEDRLLSSEQARHSTWVSEAAVDQYMSEYAEREKEEWKLADVILCGSEFVRESIAQCNGPVERCRVVPYGVDFNVIPPSNGDRTCTNLRVLTVGSISLRKGAPYVLRAARKCSSFAEFRMVGSASIAEQARRELDAHVDLTGVVPRSEVRQHYEWADVFLLPSICEGSATVTYEALAAGLPVICTPNTGSIIRDGKDGFIVPVQNAEAIAEKVRKLSSNRRLLEYMSRSASSRYTSGGTLKAYANRIHDVIGNAFN